MALSIAYSVYATFIKSYIFSSAICQPILRVRHTQFVSQQRCYQRNYKVLHHLQKVAYIQMYKINSINVVNEQKKQSRT